MKRAERLKMVQNVVEDQERRRAEQLARSEKRVTECQFRLNELETYQANYSREFASRASNGIGAAGLRDYQTFLARLSEAVRQQIADRRFQRRKACRHSPEAGRLDFGRQCRW